jgi:rhodanese-related sulfurtransferase
MSNNPSDALVSTEWLAANLSNPSIRIFDTTSFLPNVLRDAEAEYEECHIPGAVRFSVDDIADKTSGLPHMLLGSAAFAEAAGNLGVNNDTKVIAYDANGGTSASARAWWNFRVFGHDNWKRDFTGSSGLFGVVLKEGFSEIAVAAMVDNLELFGIGASWGGFESLITVPNPAGLRTVVPWPHKGPSLRLNCGLEDAGDLVNDIESGLARLNASA